MRSLLLFICGILYCTSTQHTQDHPDRVVSLPGAPLLPKFNLFSGYLNGSSNDSEIPIFYVLAEAIRVDPSTAPLLVWFNGGPGASSLLGFFLEHGPYRISEEEDVLMYNEFSWNQYANVLYLESPLGVGFSQNNEGNTTLNDLDFMHINTNALVDFMFRVHPNYADRDYFLSGQSYAGAYVPFLAVYLIDEIRMKKRVNLNFKGFSIGNPVFNLLTARLGTVLQMFNYGLVPLKHSELVLGSWMKGMEINEHDVNKIMDIFEDVMTKYIGNGTHVYFNLIEHCYTPKASISSEKYHYPTGKKSLACFDRENLESYMNRLDVKIALHATNAKTGTKKWKSVNYQLNSDYNRVPYTLSAYEGIFSLAQNVLPSFRMLIYHGDTDAALPVIHTIHSAEIIARNNSMEDQGYDREWRFYNDFAGIRNGYKKGNISMDVLTVRGAGHSVPADLPAQAFQIINNFLSGADNEEINYSQPFLKS